MNDRLPSLLTIPETAAELRVSDDTVYRLIAKGDLATTDVAPTGSRKPKTRVVRASVNELIQRRQTGRRRPLRTA
jgi:excisionase family DNA binding protein